MKRVSIAILNWNGKDLLEKFLPSVIKYTDANLANIIIADNASTDNSLSFIREQYPTLQIIELDRNYGFAEGYNKVFEKINTEYCVILNSDVEVSKNWLAPLIDFLDNNNDAAAVQPKILAQKNKDYFEYAGASGGFIDKYGYPFCRGRLFSSVEKDSLQYDEPMQIFWASGACMVIRTEEYNNAGGFDSSFFAHMEEIDLCWRLNAGAKKIYCIPTSVIFHMGGATLEKENPRKTFLNFRNNLLMLYKNTDSKKFNRIYLFRKIFDYIAALQMILNGNVRNFRATLKAHKEFNRIHKNYDNVRLANMKKQTVKNINTIYPASILFQYYIKGIRKFSKLRW